MKSNLTEQAKAFWAVMSPGIALPPLPDAPLEALRVLLNEAAAGDYFSVGVHPQPDPWPRIALGIAADHWQEQLAMTLSGLEHVGGNDSGDRWYLDTEPDDTGLHRVYWRYDDTIDPMPLCRGLGSFLGYLTQLRTAEREDLPDDAFEARLRGVPGLYDETKLADWDDDQDDGWAAYAALFEHPFPETWAHYAQGEWLEPLWTPEAPTSAANRSWMGGLLDCFTANGEVCCPPDLDREALVPARHRLVTELESFAQAIEGQTVPALVQQYIDHPDPILARGAHRWVTTFHDARR